MGVLDDHVDGLFEVARLELQRQADLVMEEAKRNIPVGDPSEDPNPAVSLPASGRVVIDDAPLTGRVVATLSFDTPYAVKQHESFHLRHPRGGGPKFLENAIIAHASRMTEEMGQALRAELSATTRKGRTRRKAF